MILPSSLIISQGWGLIDHSTARSFLTRPTTGTPKAGIGGQILPAHMLGQSFQSIRLSI